MIVWDKVHFLTFCIISSKSNNLPRMAYYSLKKCFMAHQKSVGPERAPKELKVSILRCLPIPIILV